MMKYQAVLLEQNDIKLKVTTTLNPVTLLPSSGEAELTRNCLQTIKQVYSS